MAFPTNSTVLDNFNRANEAPVNQSGAWATAANIRGGSVFCDLISNQLGITSGTFNTNYRTASFGPDTEVWCDLPTLPGAGNEAVALFLRLQTPGTTGVDGYYLEVDQNATNNWLIVKITNNVDNALLTATQVIAAGSSIGFEAVGTNLTGYYKASGGSWTQVITFSDATYGAAGQVGIEMNGTTGRADNYGGGTVVTFTADNSTKPAKPGMFTPLVLAKEWF